MITPLDIENKKFSKQMMNGYNVEDVDDFLDELVVDYEKNYKELAEANDKIEKLTKDLEQYKNLEKTLQNTLVMAQTTAEEVKIAAKQQADQLIAEARNKASEIQQEENEASLKKLDEIVDGLLPKRSRFYVCPLFMATPSGEISVASPNFRLFTFYRKFGGYT